MVKAATDWLFDQLANHADFWIPPVKELRYLNVPVPRMDNTLRKRAAYRRPRFQLGQDRNFAFLEEASRLAERPRDLRAYAALFRFKSRMLSGDISPGYYDLDEAIIREVAQRFPNIKIVLMVREPLERVWSHIAMRFREGHFDGQLLGDLNAFAEWFTASEVRRACFATEVATNWKRFAPQIAFRHFFFDDVESAPDRVRSEIICYLGGDPRKRSGKLSPDYNRKAGAPKPPFPSPIRSFLLDELAEEIRACAAVFGGPAIIWPARHGL